MRWLWATLIAVSVPTSGACSKKSDDVIARLTEHRGTVEKDVGDGWQQVQGKDGLRCDNGVRTSDASTATITFSAGGSFQLEERTDIDLSCGGNPGMSVAVGEVLVEAGPDGGEFDLEVGTVKLAGKGRYRIGQGRFDVLVGAATVRRANADSEVLEEGDGLSWEVGAATVTRVRKTEEIPDAGVPDAGVQELDAGPAPETVQAKVTGKRARIRQPGEKKWKKLKAGSHELPPGIEIRLGKRTKMRIQRGSETATIAGAAEFTTGAPGEALVASTKSGQIDIHATENPVAIKVPGGVILARKRSGDGSKARINVKRGTTNVRAERGKIDVTGKGGVEETLQIGERIVLTRDGRTKIQGRAPSSADFAMPSSETATIHAAKLPVAVAIGFPEDCTEAVVETSNRSNFRSRLTISKGTDGSANIQAKKGALYYRVRCIVDGVLQKKVRAKGRLRIVRDKATHPLPKRASQSAVDADGRRYRVLYQNRLPTITFRWPKAPEGSSYRFHLQPTKGKPSSHDTSKPSYRIRTGNIAEGQYRYYFEVDGKRSRTSTLSIEFDPDTPSTYLRSPKVNERWSGASVRVQGVALIGASVRVGDKPLSVDSNGRFSSNVDIPEGARSMAVRVSTRKRGVHYYIRRTR